MKRTKSNQYPCSIFSSLITSASTTAHTLVFLPSFVCLLSSPSLFLSLPLSFLIGYLDESFAYLLARLVYRLTWMHFFFLSIFCFICRLIPLNFSSRMQPCLPRRGRTCLFVEIASTCWLGGLRFRPEYQVCGQSGGQRGSTNWDHFPLLFVGKLGH